MSAASPVKSLNCGNCGAPLTLRAAGRSLSVVCVQCLSVLDATDPDLKVLQTFEGKQRYRPVIPLGTRGKWKGVEYQVIGFQVRGVVDEGVTYAWSEYLLFNPYRGFRYLTEYNGHWNDVRTIRSLPERFQAGKRPSVRYQRETYRLFESGEATTFFVMGEFPWQVRVGEKAGTGDFISPPRMLSSETTENEVTWSQGHYTPASEVWQAFRLAGSPPAPQGVFPNQPSPFAGKVASSFSTFLVLLLALAAMLAFFSVYSLRQEVFRQRFSYSPGGREQSLVTSIFELRGRTSNVEVAITTDLSNSWAYFNLALINDRTGQAFDFGREVSYYSGRDSDGSWSEGSSRDAAIVPSVPSGRYYLRVEPEMESGARGMTYEIRVRRDVPVNSFFLIGAILLLLPPALIAIRAASFEGRRWAAAASESSDSDSDSDSGDDD